MTMRSCTMTLALVGCFIAYHASAADQLASASAEKSSPDLKPALSAEVTFQSVSGDALDTIAPDSPFAINVKINNHAGGDPPAGLELFGWLRREDASNLQCAESAENFQRTGRLPVGAIFLNDPVIGAVTEDNAMLLVDPEFSLATANLLAAGKLSGQAAAIVADDDARRFLLPMPESGTLVAVDAAGTISVLASDLGHPVAVVPGTKGDAIVLDAFSQRLRRLSGDKVPDIKANGLRDSYNGYAAAVWGSEGAAAFDTRSGELLLKVPGRADSAAILADESPFALAVLEENKVQIHYLDAPASPPISIELAASATELAVSPHGRFLFAHDPLMGPVSVVDVARSRLVQATHADRLPISEIVVTNEAAYLMLADQSRVGVLDFVALSRGEPSEFREVPLGGARKTLLDASGYLSTLWPQSGVLAVHAESGQGYRIAEASAMGNAPPMTFTPIRGGVPRRVAVLDRSFREEPRGSFRTVASLPGPGRWELVATTGIGSLSFCASLPVLDEGDPTQVPGLLNAVVEIGTRALRLKLTDGDGIAVSTEGEITFSALSGAWRDTVYIRTDNDGLSDDIYDLPESGTVVVTISERDGGAWLPLVLEDLK